MPGDAAEAAAGRAAWHGCGSAAIRLSLVLVRLSLVLLSYLLRPIRYRQIRCRQIRY